jgi:hypothetical protein
VTDQTKGWRTDRLTERGFDRGSERAMAWVTEQRKHWRVGWRKDRLTERGPERRTEGGLERAMAWMTDKAVPRQAGSAVGSVEVLLNVSLLLWQNQGFAFSWIAPAER